MQNLNNDQASLEYYINYIKESSEMKNDIYGDIVISKIVISHGVKEGYAPNNRKEIPKGNLLNKMNY